MDSFAAARDKAKFWRALLLQDTSDDVRASAILAAAYRQAGLRGVALADTDSLLDGVEAVLDRETKAIFFKASATLDLAHFQQAHEFGHYWLDSERAACAASSFGLSAEEPAPFGAARVEGYGPKERRECQANAFAREFLLPESEAKALFARGKKGSEIAEVYELEIPLVMQQLARGLLLPEELPQDEAAAPKSPPPLDSSQREAAHAPKGPILLEAGPGTGKTRTLVARVEWLLEHKVDPASILILTFSNKAAGELRERIAAVAPDAATQLWAGTFHQFGLDLLRQYGELVGLPPDPKIFDQNDALGLLEQHLSALPLDHYLTLYDPASALADILKAISRAKDELATPIDYLNFASAMPAENSEQTVAREKAIEIAGVYAAYEKGLAEVQALDFGDLIKRSCEFLETHDAMRSAITAKYRYILVDEFQDVNFASAKLLKQMAGSGQGLWVVGDARQSIYRFRGASPDNIRDFVIEYPTAIRMALAVNYRSTRAIVASFELFARKMQASAGGLAAKWDAHSGDGGPVCFNVATTLDAEAIGIGKAIRERRANGTSYRDQAILCRTHNMLAKFARALEAQGIPVLYLGDIFERPEIRDLLSLISVAAEPASSGLVRASMMPDYRIAAADLQLVTAHAAEQGMSLKEAVVRLPDAISPEARDHLTKLNADIGWAGQKTSALFFLNSFLFEKSRWLAPLLADDSVQGQQRRVAIFQLLQVAHAYGRNNRSAGCRGFLDWVRRLEQFGEERQLRAPPAAASGIDAVRMLTVHASKGLEFEALYLPALATSTFPQSNRYDPCPLPPGLITRTQAQIRIEEEECLFFVALSRAQSHLHLSTARNYGSNRSPSAFLSEIEPILERTISGAPDWIDEGDSLATVADLGGYGRTLANHRNEDLDQYLKCPRAYLYQRIIGLSGGRDDTGYVQFHRAVYDVLRSLDALQQLPDPARAASEALSEAWTRIGPVGHPFEPIYRRQAEDILARAAAHWRDADPIPTEWNIVQGGTEIRVRPDFVTSSPQGLKIRRLRTGRAPKTPPDDNIYALYHAGSKLAPAPATIEVHYLGSDTIVQVSMSPKVIENRLKKYDDAIAGIGAGRFPPAPDDRVCPRCPQYFICAAPCL